MKNYSEVTNPAIDLIVTRHDGLVEYLLDEGIVDSSVDVIPHANVEAITGRNVLGVLPHNLSKHCGTFTEVPLALPPSKRGRELSADDIRMHAGSPVTYKVIELKDAWDYDAQVLDGNAVDKIRTAARRLSGDTMDKDEQLAYAELLGEVIDSLEDLTSY